MQSLVRNMKTILSIVKNGLEESISGRERKFKNKFLRELVLQRLGLEGSMFYTTENLDDYGPLFQTFDRAWRKVTAENGELRGSDYGEKEEVESEMIMHLGYAVGV